MENYKQRTETPKETDKNYINVDFGGKNKCIAINTKNGYVLPNCTGYCFGRWLELLGKTPDLSIYQAELWFTHKDKYERGYYPKIGSIICWSKGNPKNPKDGAGHVAIVEDIYLDGTILCTMSGSNTNKKFWRQKLTPPYSYGKKYNLQGYIYNPIEYTEPKTHFPGIFPKLPLIKKCLSYGDKGEQVKYLQIFLNWCNSCKLIIDGSFGPATEKQVRLYQENYNLKVDGLFGPASLDKAKKIIK